jgi:ABC-type multidrug transport system fused ATPase/permease subunit
MMRFLSYLKPYRWRLVLATLIGVLKYNLPVIFPWVLKDVIDNLLAGKPSKTGLSFDHLMGLSVALFIFYAGITYLRSHIADRMAQSMIFDVRRDLFRHLQKLPIDFFYNHQTGAVSSRLFTDVSMAQNFISLVGTNLFMDLTSFGSITFVVFTMNWKLGFIAYSTLPIYIVLHRWVGQRMRKNAKEARRRMEILEGAFHETVSGISEIKSFTGEKEETRRFLIRCRSYLEAVYENIQTSAFSLGTTALLTRLPSVMVIWIGGHLVLKEQLTVGALIAFYAYLEMIYNPLNRLNDLNIQIANSRAAIDRLFEFLDLEPEVRNESAPPLIVRRGNIEYHNVVFGYQNNHPIFQGLNLNIPMRLRTALVGPSGAGKSTLIKLLIRFFDPWDGKITIDGQDILLANLSSLRSKISLVQQDLMLFSGTIEDNIRIGKADATRNEIRKAAEFANAILFIEKLPKDFQTEIGERGVKLSGGQKQLIAIARAFLKDAPILVLDESTSNLDNSSESLIYGALERLMKDRTTLVIAHRMSTVVKAEMVVVFDHGRIIQQGRHEDLLRATDGLYYRLYSEAVHLREDLEAPYLIFQESGRS